MLNKNARKVLKYFIKTQSAQSINTIAYKVKLSNDENQSYELSKIAIDDLKETNCIKDTFEGLQLTNFGKTYFKQALSSWIKSILNGIVFPIIVALITALITTMLTIYLSQYQSNKQLIEIQCDCKNDRTSNP